MRGQGLGQEPDLLGGAVVGAAMVGGDHEEGAEGGHERAVDRREVSLQWGASRRNPMQDALGGEVPLDRRFFPK